MGIYDGFTNHDEKKENQIEYSDDFYIIANHLYLNKNIKIHLNIDQYTNKFKLVNNKLDIDPNQIFMNPKSLVKMDSTGNFIGSIMTDQNDKLKLNYNSDLYEDYNGSIWINLGNGIERSSDNKISIALGFATKFDNGKLSLDTSALVNNTSGTITLDPDKKRFELNYSTDMLKDYTGKIWLNINNDFKRENNAISLKLNNNHFRRENDGISLNIDDSIKYDVNTNKLSSNIDKYLTTGGDIYLDNNGKMKLNINNYVIDNSSTIIMDTNNKLTVNITDQSAGQVYLDNQNHLKLRLSPFYFTDSSGYFYPKINYNHGFDWQNYQLNLNIDSPLYFTTNKKLGLSYNEYFKQTNDGKLDLDLNKIKIETVKPSGPGIQINSDGTFSLNNQITKLLNLSPLSGLEISGDQLIINEHTLSRNVIKLNSNSPITRDNNNFFEIVYDRISIDTDNKGVLKVKNTYIPSIVTADYIKNKVQNELYFKDMLKFQGLSILKRGSLCYWDLNNESHVNKTIRINNVVINKFENEKHIFNDYYYFTTENHPTYHYKHYSFEIFTDVINDNYIYFNNTNQKIKYTDIFYKQTNFESLAFNIVFECEKKAVDINSTLMECEDNYIKLLYNNQGIIFKMGKMINNYINNPTYPNEIIVSLSSTLINKKHILTFYYDLTKVLIILNSQIVYENNDLILFVNEEGKDNLITHKYHNFYIGNNSNNLESYKGKIFDYSMLQNITEQEAINLHEYYKYIHNI